MSVSGWHGSVSNKNTMSLYDLTSAGLFALVGWLARDRLVSLACWCVALTSFLVRGLGLDHVSWLLFAQQSAILFLILANVLFIATRGLRSLSMLLGLLVVLIPLTESYPWSAKVHALIQVLGAVGTWIMVIQ